MTLALDPPWEPHPAIPRRLQLLVSYAYLRGNPDRLHATSRLADGCELLLDSGAFTDYYVAQKAAAQGKAYTPISLGEYMRDVATFFHGRVYGYIMLDKLKDPEVSRRNWETMVENDLAPMGVWVAGEDVAVTRDFVSVNPKLCVAGGPKAKRPYARQRYQRAWIATEGAARIHALGYVRWPDMWQLPIASCDASSFASGNRWGRISRFDPLRGVVSIGQRELMPEGHAGRHAGIGRYRADQAREWFEYLLQCNVTPAVLADEKKMAQGPLSVISLLTRWAHLQWHDLALERGVRYFLAISLLTPHDIVTMAALGTMRGESDCFDYSRWLTLSAPLLAEKTWQGLAERAVAMLGGDRGAA